MGLKSTADADFVVTVTDIQDTPPSFFNLVYSVSLKENVTVVGCIAIYSPPLQVGHGIRNVKCPSHPPPHLWVGHGSMWMGPFFLYIAVLFSMEGNYDTILVWIQTIDYIIFYNLCICFTGFVWILIQYYVNSLHPL